MMSREQNEQLSRIGPGTLMGKLLRRYWAPFLLASEIPEPDCPPVKVKLMGERLIAFRDSKGRVGLIDEFCAHRGASLWFGESADCGIRCQYHGWKYDITGQCVDLPSEPEESGFRKNIKLKSYPCIEKAGIVWAYMGPPELQPPPPALEWTDVAPEQRFVSKRLQECNYLQAMEGGIDSSHVSWLHGSELNKDPLFKGSKANAYNEHDRMPLFEVEEFSGGLLIGARRNGDERQLLLAHHALDHALVHHHPAARRASSRRARLGADRRRELLGLEHQLPSQARAVEIGNLGDAGRRGHPRQIRARHIHPARQQVEQLPDGSRGAAARPFRHRRRRHRHAGRFDSGKHGADPGPHHASICARPTPASS